MNNNSICPSCGVRFKCNANTFEVCDCTKIEMSVKEREYLNRNYKGCLCTKCILKIKKELEDKIA